MTLDHDRLERWLLTLACYEMAAREQLDRAGNLDDAEGLAARAKALNDELWRLGVPSPAPPLPATSAPPRISIAQALDSTQERPCPACHEPIPTGWNTHTYKKDQSPCGWTARTAK